MGGASPIVAPSHGQSSIFRVFENKTAVFWKIIGKFKMKEFCSYGFWKMRIYLGNLFKKIVFCIFARKRNFGVLFWKMKDACFWRGISMDFEETIFKCKNSLIEDKYQISYSTIKLTTKGFVQNITYNKVDFFRGSKPLKKLLKTLKIYYFWGFN